MKSKRSATPPPIASRRRAEHLGIGDLHELELEAALYLESDPQRPGAEHLKGVLDASRLALAAIAGGDAIGGATMAMQALHHAWLAEIAEGRPLIEAGVKTTRGRVKGNETKSEVAEAERAVWQREAERLWAANPRLSKREVAKRVAPGRGDYARKHIGRPIDKR